MPLHAGFKLVLITVLVATWSHPVVRTWLVVGLARHATMRI
jgi:hypothetical protein